MEDDKLKKLFDDFRPALSSDSQFMARLQRSLEAVEFVRQQNALYRRRNRMAVAIAALCGFVMGVVVTLMFPLFGDLLASIPAKASFISLETMEIARRTILWLAVAFTSVLTALNAYEIAMTKLPERR